MYIILHIFIVNTTFRYSELITDETINKYLGYMYIILHIFIFNTTFRYSELITDETINKLFKFIDSELNNVSY